jgi:hypothetical protein
MPVRRYGFRLFLIQVARSDVNDARASEGETDKGVGILRRPNESLGVARMAGSATRRFTNRKFELTTQLLSVETTNMQTPFRDNMCFVRLPCQIARAKGSKLFCPPEETGPGIALTGGRP